MEPLAKDVEIGVDPKAAQLVTLAKHLMGRGRRRGGGRVTDLLFPRKTYFRIKHPEVELTEEEVGFFLAGAGHHELIEYIASIPEFREVSVEWKGIRGRVDLIGNFPNSCVRCGANLRYAADLWEKEGIRARCRRCSYEFPVEEWPVEIKTTRSTRESTPEEVVRDRPHYLDQLGMYCAMTNKKRGKLLVFHLGVREPDGGLKPKLVMYDVGFRDLDSIRKATLGRKHALAYAVEADDPGALPTCPDWLCRSCKFFKHCGGAV